MPERVRGQTPSVPRTSDFEERDLTPSELRHLILEEINSYQRYEVEMQRRPSLVSDGRGPPLVGIAPPVPARTTASRVTESDESARTTEATAGRAGSSANPLLSPTPASAADPKEAQSKRARARASTGQSADAADASRDEAGADKTPTEHKRSRR